MKTGRPKQREIVLNETVAAHLQSYARSRSLPHALVRRARIVLMSAGGHSNVAIAAALQVSAATVGPVAGAFSRARPGGFVRRQTLGTCAHLR